MPCARLCWSDCQAFCDPDTLLDAAMYCENPAVDRAATVIVTPGSRHRLPYLMFVGSGSRKLRPILCPEKSTVICEKKYIRP